MGVRFNKSIKLGKLLRINLSKSGVSATIGKKGASINLGKNGTYFSLSPSIVGIKGTGLSYRQRLGAGYKSLLNGSSSLKKADASTANSSIDTSVIDKYIEELNTKINIHHNCPVILNEENFIEEASIATPEESKEVFETSAGGDEDTIETLVGTFMSKLKVGYDVKASYELEDHDLYVDLDLPEIEDFSNQYPCVVKNEVVYKEKSQKDIRCEYAQLIMSLGIYLSANFFNCSSYIKTIILSAFTSRRNSDGDLKDVYLYSVKYTRDIFEKTDLKELDNLYEFICKFENRINFNPVSYTFKQITPFEMVSISNKNKLIDEAISGLKELGYKVGEINKIKNKLEQLELETSSDYIKEALRLLAE